METNKSLESIKVKMKQKNPAIKEVEFVKYFSPLDFSVRLGLIINGEKMPFYLTYETMQEIKFSGCIGGTPDGPPPGQDVENEIVASINNEYDKLEFKNDIS